MCWSCLRKGFVFSFIASAAVLGFTQMAFASSESLEQFPSQVITIEKTGALWQVQDMAEEMCRYQEGMLVSSYEASRSTPTTSVWRVECEIGQVSEQPLVTDSSADQEISAISSDFKSF